MLGCGFNRIPTTRVATRIGLAQLWIQSGTDDASGNSHWAYSAVDSIGYRRREWQLAFGLLSRGFSRIPTTGVATRLGLMVSRRWNRNLRSHRENGLLDGCFQRCCDGRNMACSARWHWACPVWTHRRSTTRTATIPTMRVVTRMGLAEFWIPADIDDASGNSHFACSALDGACLDLELC